VLFLFKQALISTHEKVQSMRFDRLAHGKSFAFILTIFFLGFGLGSQFSKAEQLLELNACQALFLSNEETELEQLTDHDPFESVFRLFFPHFNFTGLNIRSNPVTFRYHSESCHILSRPPPPISIF